MPQVTYEKYGFAPLVIEAKAVILSDGSKTTSISVEDMEKVKEYYGNQLTSLISHL